MWHQSICLKALSLSTRRGVQEPTKGPLVGSRAKPLAGPRGSGRIPLKPFGFSMSNWHITSLLAIC